MDGNAASTNTSQQKDASLRMFMELSDGEADKKAALYRALDHTLAIFRERLSKAAEEKDQKALHGAFHFIKPTCTMFRLTAIKALTQHYDNVEKFVSPREIGEFLADYDREVTRLLTHVKTVL